MASFESGNSSRTARQSTVPLGSVIGLGCDGAAFALRVSASRQPATLQAAPATRVPISSRRLRVGMETPGQESGSSWRLRRRARLKLACQHVAINVGRHTADYRVAYPLPLGEPKRAVRTHQRRPMSLSFKRAIDTVALGSDRPIRRLLAYYLILGGIFAALLYFCPIVGQIASGERLEELTQAPQVLQDGLTSGAFQSQAAKLPSSVQLALTTTLCIVATLLLMLPVTWVYMSARRTKRHNQAVVETLIMLPIVVAGIILIVRNSLALAFSLAGVVAAVRFRTTLRDTRDTVFIFLAIGIGFAAGVQAITVGAIASVIFNLVLWFVWRTDFGRK